MPITDHGDYRHAKRLALGSLENVTKVMRFLESEPSTDRDIALELYSRYLKEASDKLYELLKL